VTPSFAASPRGPFAVTPSFAASPRGPFAVTPSFAASPRGPFAMTPSFAASPRGPFAVTPSFAASPGGPFAVTPWGPMAVSAQQIPMMGGMPAELRKVMIDTLMATSPQRATDIFYEDDQTVYIMRQGQQYQLKVPDSMFWAELGNGTASEMLGRVAEKMGRERDEAMEMAFVNFLLAGEQVALLSLYPQEKTARQTSRDPREPS
jgi:hypothetical protein